MNNNIPWATPLGQFDCDGFIVNVWRPRRFLRWLFPGYWRFRLPDGLVSMFRVVGAKEALGYTLLHWRERSGFIDPHNYTAQEMPPVISLSRDGGDTWTEYSNGQSGVCVGIDAVAMSDEHYIVAVPEVEQPQSALIRFGIDKGMPVREYSWDGGKTWLGEQWDGLAYCWPHERERPG